MFDQEISAFERLGVLGKHTGSEVEKCLPLEDWVGKRLAMKRAFVRIDRLPMDSQARGLFIDPSTEPWSGKIDSKIREMTGLKNVLVPYLG